MESFLTNKNSLIWAFNENIDIDMYNIKTTRLHNTNKKNNITKNMFLVKTILVIYSSSYASNEHKTSANENFVLEQLQWNMDSRLFKSTGGSGIPAPLL